MSYEGYVEYLCAKGHRWTEDVYYAGDINEMYCSDCGGVAVWQHSVDETNGEQYDENGVPYPSTVPFPLEVDHWEKQHWTRKVPIYKVPK